MLCLLISPCVSGQNVRIGVLDEGFVVENSNIIRWIRENASNYGDFVQNSIIKVLHEIMENHYKDLLDRTTNRACQGIVPDKVSQRMEEELQELQKNSTHLHQYIDTAFFTFENEYINWLNVQKQLAIDSVAKLRQYDIVFPSKIILSKSIVVAEEIQQFSQEVLDLLNKVPYTEFQKFSNSKKAEWTHKIQQQVLYPTNPVFSYLYKKNIFTIMLLSLSYLKFQLLT